MKTKVYFTASLRGVQYFSEHYKQIYKALEELNCEHLDSEIITLSRIKYYNLLDTKGKKAHTELFNKKLKVLQDAQVCVFEVSTQSLSIGLQIQKSIDYHKPTVIMFQKDNAPYFLDGIIDEKLILAPYESSNIKTVVTNALQLAHEKRDNRYNFYISTELLTYLEEASKKKGQTKSNYIRNLIEQDRNKQLTT